MLIQELKHNIQYVVTKLTLNFISNINICTNEKLINIQNSVPMLQKYNLNSASKYEDLPMQDNGYKLFFCLFACLGADSRIYLYLPNLLYFYIPLFLLNPFPLPKEERQKGREKERGEERNP